MTSACCPASLSLNSDAMEILSEHPPLDGRGLRIGIVQARFNAVICEGLAHACLQGLETLGVACADVLLVKVPGALEIPFALQKLAQSKRFNALIALGAVIRGATYHFEVVAQGSSAGMQKVGLDFDTPIVHAVLTTYTESQAISRMTEKGREAAHVAVEMAHLAALLDRTL